MGYIKQWVSDFTIKDSNPVASIARCAMSIGDGHFPGWYALQGTEMIDRHMLRISNLFARGFFDLCFAQKSAMVFSRRPILQSATTQAPIRWEKAFLVDCPLVISGGGISGIDVPPCFIDIRHCIYIWLYMIIYVYIYMYIHTIS